MVTTKMEVDKINTMTSTIVAEETPTPGQSGATNDVDQPELSSEIQEMEVSDGRSHENEGIVDAEQSLVEPVEQTNAGELMDEPADEPTDAFEEVLPVRRSARIA
jgi:hypothetical protein